MSCYPSDAHWSQKGTGEREMQSEVVEDDRPGGSACASPAGKSSKGSAVTSPMGRQETR
jgi:hypothetical protein